MNWFSVYLGPQGIKNRTTTASRNCLNFHNDIDQNAKLN